jgi:hypothetical protein
LPPLGTLAPGAFRTITQNLPINIVFVGYKQGAGPRDIDDAAFRAQLPASYDTIKRFPAFYGLLQRMGILFNYQYNVVYANQAFEDAFFAYLTNIAVARTRTTAQNAYNGQPARSRDVGQNHRIDAPSVEACSPRTARTSASIPTSTRYSSSTGTGEPTSKTTSTTTWGNLTPIRGAPSARSAPGR